MFSTLKQEEAEYLEFDLDYVETFHPVYHQKQSKLFHDVLTYYAPDHRLCTATF